MKNPTELQEQSRIKHANWIEFPETYSAYFCLLIISIRTFGISWHIELSIKTNRRKRGHGKAPPGKKGVLLL